MGGERQYLLCLAAGKRLALALDRVIEVTDLPPLTRIPRPVGAVEGFARLRGQTILVMDLRKRLGLVNPRQGEQVRVILCRPASAERKPVGIIVDAVAGVLTLGGEEAVAEAGGPEEPDGLIVGVIQQGGEQIFVADPTGLML